VAALIRSTDEKMTKKKTTAITCVFLDNGVLLTDGGDQHT